MINQIFNEDCLEGMKRIPDGSVDMILCDLPYGTTQNQWDSIIPLEPMWEQYKRIIKPNGAIVLTAQPPFDKILGCSNLAWLKYEWIWYKHRGTGHLNAQNQPLRAHENILVFYKKQPTYNAQGLIVFKKMQKRGSNGSNYNKSKTENFQEYTNYPKSVLEYADDVERLHPTQKPLSLFTYLIRTYTNDNETILDNCMGSGTTAIAALETGRNYIGFEKDHTYFKLCMDRIDVYNRQLKLF